MDPERLHELEQAAIRAEMETGVHEETEAQARSHVLIRLARMSVGVLVVLAGILMLPLPGPGWLVIAGGLVVLSRDVAWADRLLRYVRRRVPGVPEDGSIPRSTWLVAGFLGAAGAAVSLWFAF